MVLWRKLSCFILCGLRNGDDGGSFPDTVPAAGQGEGDGDCWSLALLPPDKLWLAMGFFSSPSLAFIVPPECCSLVFNFELNIALLVQNWCYALQVLTGKDRCLYKPQNLISHSSIPLATRTFCQFSCIFTGRVFTIWNYILDSQRKISNPIQFRMKIRSISSHFVPDFKY